MGQTPPPLARTVMVSSTHSIIGWAIGGTLYAP